MPPQAMAGFGGKRTFTVGAPCFRVYPVCDIIYQPLKPTSCAELTEQQSGELQALSLRLMGIS